MKRFVITGADGFLGSSLAKKLLAENAEVWGLVIPNSPTAWRIQGLSGLHVVECELNNLGNVEIPSGADALFHFAWQGVAPDQRDNLDVQLENLDYSMAVARFAAARNVGRFIIPGSTSEYAHCGTPINAKALPTPLNAYGSTKIAVRFLCAELAKQLGLPFIYVVITGIYSADRRDNNVIFYTINKLLNGEKPSLTKLEQLWDYVHINDVLDALSLVAQKGKDGAFYTIGHGDNQPLARYIETIRDIIDPSLPLGIGEVPYRDNLLPGSCVDLSAICADTGFTPSVAFEKGIRQVIHALRAERTQQAG